MKKRIFFARAAALALAWAGLTSLAAAQELRVLVHSAFSLPKPLLAQFEAQSGIKLSIIKGGAAGEMLNKLILTRGQPVADVVFGIDNTLVAKAQAAQVLAPNGLAATSLGSHAVAVDYGYVMLNYDKAALAKSAVPLPKTLEDLTQGAYRDWLVLPNPATSSPGYAFMLATIAGMGEEKAFDWWARMRANGLKVTKGWSEAYYTEFTRNGGTRPLVLSYASSPAAEVFYSKEKITEAPTASLPLKGGVFRQVEGVALVAGGAQREAALKFIDFLRSGPVQEALQTSMWMFPAQDGAPRVEAMRYATEPSSADGLTPELMADKGPQWLARWTQVVLK
jgi:thiamine transport system substrate-binding protein